MGSVDEQQGGETVADANQFARSTLQILRGKSVDPLLKNEEYLQQKGFLSMTRLKGTATPAAAKAAAIPRKKGLKVKAEKYQVAQLKRVMTYEQTVEDVSRWEPLVKDNRLADQMTFPLQQPDLHLKGAAEITKRFSKRTSLEQQVAEALGREGYFGNTKRILSRKEEGAVRAAAVEEARERRAQLRKGRLLQSVREAEARRRKKIKSKGYHRVLRKERERKEKSALEKMEREDPEGFAQLQERGDRRRMEERMSLKHRGGSKFARERSQYKKFDTDTRNALSTMYDKSRELTKKTEARISDESDSEMSDAGEEEQEDATAGVKAEAGSNPWMATATVSGPSKTPRVQLIAPVSKIESDSESESESESEGEEVVEASCLAKLNHQSVLTSHGDSSESSSEESEVDAADVKEIVGKSMDEIFREAEAGKSHKKPASTAGQGRPEQLQSKCRKQGKPGKRKLKLESRDREESSSGDEDDEGGLVEVGDRLRTLEDVTRWAKKEGEQKQPTNAPVPSKQRRLGATEESNASNGRKGQADINPKNVMPLRAATINHTLNASLAVDEGEEEKRITIAQAFADDDVVAEFAEQKRNVVEHNKPKDIDLTLPGWGSWGGANLEPSNKKRKRFIVKAKPVPPRKDKGLKNVIISECADRTVDKFRVSTLPFQYGRVSQFESAIRAPVGKNWNPETVVRKLVAPKVVTKVGSVIQPIQESELLSRTQQTKGKKQQQASKQTKGKKGKF